ncbi:hypothetical protein PENSPDRAFT_749600 [Peniophora sp. CONT]|nr:hypothetical protein PENSPDRAFT_749600 [Peniophora sp. CONT]
MSTDALFDLLRGYSALLPVAKLRYPTALPFTEVHDFVLENIVLNAHLAAYPPSAPYQQTFYKWLINCLEEHLGNEDAAIDDRLYDKLFDSMSETRCVQCISPVAMVPPPTYVTHYWNPKSTRHDPPPENTVCGRSTVTLFESRTTIESGTTGLRTWRASFVLARHFIAHSDIIQDCTVLELGSGTGFLGIVVASLQVLCHNVGALPAVALTDINETVIERCIDNVRLPCNVSASHPRISVRPLDWMDALESTRLTSLRSFLDEVSPDIVLGADVLYHPDIIPALVATLKEALNRKPTSVAYLAITVRNPDLLQTLLTEVVGRGLVFEELVAELGANNDFLENYEGIDQKVALLKIVTRS